MVTKLVEKFDSPTFLILSILAASRVNIKSPCTTEAEKIANIREILRRLRELNVPVSTIQPEGALVITFITYCQCFTLANTEVLLHFWPFRNCTRQQEQHHAAPIGHFGVFHAQSHTRRETRDSRQTRGFWWPTGLGEPPTWPIEFRFFPSQLHAERCCQ